MGGTDGPIAERRKSATVSHPHALSGVGQEAGCACAQGIDPIQQLQTRERPGSCSSAIAPEKTTATRWKGAQAGQRADRRGSYASAGSGWKIQEVSRVGAQSVTSKSKLLAREMPRVCSSMQQRAPGLRRPPARRPGLPPISRLWAPRRPPAHRLCRLTPRVQVGHFPGQKLRLGGGSLGADPTCLLHLPFKIGRASCRERV